MHCLPQQHIVTLSLQEGRKFLCEREPQFAIPAALGALKVLTEIHGGAHTQLTPAYLILAEAAIGMSIVALRVLLAVVCIFCDDGLFVY